MASNTPASLKLMIYLPTGRQQIVETDDDMVSKYGQIMKKCPACGTFLVLLLEKFGDMKTSSTRSLDNLTPQRMLRGGWYCNRCGLHMTPGDKQGTLERKYIQKANTSAPLFPDSSPISSTGDKERASTSAPLLHLPNDVQESENTTDTSGVGSLRSQKSNESRNQNQDEPSPIDMWEEELQYGISHFLKQIRGHLAEKAQHMKQYQVKLCQREREILQHEETVKDNIQRLEGLEQSLKMKLDRLNMYKETMVSQIERKVQQLYVYEQKLQAQYSVTKYHNGTQTDNQISTNRARVNLTQPNVNPYNYNQRFEGAQNAQPAAPSPIPQNQRYGSTNDGLQDKVHGKPPVIPRNSGDYTSKAYNRSQSAYLGPQKPNAVEGRTKSYRVFATSKKQQRRSTGSYFHESPAMQSSPNPNYYNQQENEPAQQQPDPRYAAGHTPYHIKQKFTAPRRDSWNKQDEYERNQSYQPSNPELRNQGTERHQVNSHDAYQPNYDLTNSENKGKTWLNPQQFTPQGSDTVPQEHVDNSIQFYETKLKDLRKSREQDQADQDKSNQYINANGWNEVEPVRDEKGKRENRSSQELISDNYRKPSWQSTDEVFDDRQEPPGGYFKHKSNDKEPVNSGYDRTGTLDYNDGASRDDSKEYNDRVRNYSRQVYKNNVDPRQKVLEDRSRVQTQIYKREQDYNSPQMPSGGFARWQDDRGGHHTPKTYNEVNSNPSNSLHAHHNHQPSGSTMSEGSQPQSWGEDNNQVMPPITYETHYLPYDRDLGSQYSGSLASPHGGGFVRRVTEL